MFINAPNCLIIAISRLKSINYDNIKVNISKYISILDENEEIKYYFLYGIIFRIEKINIIMLIKKIWMIFKMKFGTFIKVIWFNKQIMKKSWKKKQNIFYFLRKLMEKYKHITWKSNN